jgi:hypothetical protein
LRKRTRHGKTDGLVLPYILYFDEKNSDNTLGTRRKANCLEDGFVKLPFLPIEFEAKLEKILVVFNYKTIHKQYGNKLMLDPLIELKKLEEEAVHVLVNGEAKNVKLNKKFHR